MFNELKDEKNRFFQFESKDLITRNDRKKILQTGYFESRILCSECDNNVIGKLERYGAMALYSKQILGDKAPVVENIIDIKGNKFLKISNIDYHKFKLFLLSVLWRSSIASSNFFSEVNLGAHEENIRKMILESNSKSEMDYPITEVTI